MLSVYGIVLLLIATVLGPSQQSSPQFEGRCTTFGVCGQNEDNLKFYSCEDTNPARLMEKEALEKLKTVCPTLYNGEGTTYSCCDSNDFDYLQTTLEFPKSLVHHCPGCWHNFREMYCQMHCSPQQSHFVQITEVKPYSNGKNSVMAINFYVNSSFAEGAFRSCQNVTSESLGIKVMDLSCGEWGYANCTTERWLQFLGDTENGEVPIPINSIIVDSPQISVNGTVFKPLNSQIVECHQPVPGSNSNATCGCDNCEAECI